MLNKLRLLTMILPNFHVLTTFQVQLFYLAPVSQEVKVKCFALWLVKILASARSSRSWLLDLKLHHSNINLKRLQLISVRWVLILPFLLFTFYSSVTFWKVFLNVTLIFLVVNIQTSYQRIFLLMPSKNGLVMLLSVLQLLLLLSLKVSHSLSWFP